MAKIIVTPEELEKTARTIEVAANLYKEQYENLYKENNELADKWKGEDNDAYKQRIEGFKPDLKNMYSLMCDYVHFLRVSAKTYRDAQDDVVRDANRLEN